MKKRLTLIVCIPAGQGNGILNLVTLALKIGLGLLKKKHIELSEPEEVDGDLGTVDYKITVNW